MASDPSLTGSCFNVDHSVPDKSPSDIMLRDVQFDTARETMCNDVQVENSVSRVTHWIGEPFHPTVQYANGTDEKKE
jgi:hypothetical protein